MWREAVSATSSDPLTGTKQMASGVMISPGFFKTLGIPLLAGRELDDAADQNHPRVAIVSSTVAESLFPNGDAVGKSIRFGFVPDYQNIEIVGIARNARLYPYRR